MNNALILLGTVAHCLLVIRVFIVKFRADYFHIRPSLNLTRIDIVIVSLWVLYQSQFRVKTKEC